jgi:hypothetical protein
VTPINTRCGKNTLSQVSIIVKAGGTYSYRCALKDSIATRISVRVPFNVPPSGKSQRSFLFLCPEIIETTVLWPVYCPHSLRLLRSLSARHSVANHPRCPDTLHLCLSFTLDTWITYELRKSLVFCYQHHTLVLQVAWHETQPWWSLPPFCFVQACTVRVHLFPKFLPRLKTEKCRELVQHCPPCACVCVCVCARARVRACMHACMYVYMYACVYIYVYMKGSEKERGKAIFIHFSFSLPSGPLKCVCFLTAQTVLLRTY